VLFGSFGRSLRLVQEKKKTKDAVERNLGDRAFEVGTVYSRGGTKFLCVQAPTAPTPVLIVLASYIGTVKLVSLDTFLEDIDSFTRVRNLPVDALRTSWGVSLAEFDLGVTAVLDQYRFQEIAKGRRKPGKSGLFGIMVQVKTSILRGFT